MKLPPKPKGHTKVFKTKNKTERPSKRYEWWLADGSNEKAEQLITTTVFLREQQTDKNRKAVIFSRLYGNRSIFSFVGSNASSMSQNNGLPPDRPTFNVIQSAADTLISRISQNRPAPVFLTDNSDYKERNLAKQLNHFILGELYQTKAYEKASMMLRDALVLGTGVLHVYETEDHKVGLERVLLTELFTDPQESFYGEPRQLYRVKLIDRQVLASLSPKYKAAAAAAESAYIDNSIDTSKTVSDMVLVVEGWHLRSGKEAKDGRHTIACSAGILLDEEYTKDTFPFAFLHFSAAMSGFWAQGLAEQLMGTQLEINSLLYTISRAIKLVGVPRVFQEAGSKVMSTANNNDIGVIIKYSGIKPEYEVAASNAPELYEQLQRMIDYAYQQCGVSAMQASSNKPAGLNSGEAQRVYDDISTDRFASLSRKYDNVFIELAYLITDKAKEICEEQGKYQTIYPNKDGTKQIDLPKMSLIEDPFVIQCFNTSALPRDPAGRMQKVTEMAQSGMISMKEARRLLDYPDLDQIEKLANASEERIFQILDKIIDGKVTEDGRVVDADHKDKDAYTPPDSFMDLQEASTLVVQYINLYSGAKLEEEKLELLRTFFQQVQALVQAAMPPPMPQPGAQAPGQPPTAGQDKAVGAMAAPQAQAQSPLVPNGSIG